MSSAAQVIVAGGFDDIRSRDLRFLEEASKLGELTVVAALAGCCVTKTQLARPQNFRWPERSYFPECGALCL